jgi:hypothetical protein
MNYKKPRGPVTKSKFLQEVSKRIDWHIRDLLQYAYVSYGFAHCLNNSTDVRQLFPFDESVGEEWRLREGVKFEDMWITQLDYVSTGS